MIRIAHRGNVDGPKPELENEPNYIDQALNLHYDVEVDLWIMSNNLFTGHDEPQYNISMDWLSSRKNRLWIHCKNLEAMSYLNPLGNIYHYFWHENDTVTLTSRNYIWAFPGKQPIKNSIAVMPEIYNDDLSMCLGICSDHLR